jgi:hypothetical protein
MVNVATPNKVALAVAAAALLWGAVALAAQADPQAPVDVDCERTARGLLPGWHIMCGKYPDGSEGCWCQTDPRFDAPIDPAVLAEQQRLLQQELQRRAEQARQKQDEMKAR